MISSMVKRSARYEPGLIVNITGSFSAVLLRPRYRISKSNAVLGPPACPSVALARATRGFRGLMGFLGRLPVLLGIDRRTGKSRICDITSYRGVQCFFRPLPELLVRAVIGRDDLGLARHGTAWTIGSPAILQLYLLIPVMFCVIEPLSFGTKSLGMSRRNWERKVR